MIISAKPLTLLTLGLSMAALTAPSLTIPSWGQPSMRASGPAQNGRPQGRGGRMLNRMGEDLNLSAAQKARIKAIVDGANSQARAVDGKAGLSRDQKNAQMMQIMRGMRAKVDAVLTPAQKKKQASLRAQSEAQARTRRMAALDREAKILGLSGQQTTRMKAVVDSAMKQRKAVRDNDSLQPDQRRAKSRQIAQTMRAQMDAILTPAQRQKAASMRQSFRGDRGGNGGRLDGGRPQGGRAPGMRM